MTDGTRESPRTEGTPRRGRIPPRAGSSVPLVHSSGISPLAGPVVVLIILGGVPGTVTAHGLHDATPAGLGFGSVLIIPVLAGAIGGLVAFAPGGSLGSPTFRRWLRDGLSVVPLLVGMTFAAVALGRHRGLGILGLAGGMVLAGWVLVLGSDGPARVGGRGQLALLGIGLHRAMEGLLVGILYADGSALGTLAAAVVAVHTLIETSTVGALNDRAPRRLLAVVVAVQAAYVAGAVGGFFAGGSVSTLLQVLIVGLAGGLLLVSGGDALVRHPQSSPSVLADGGTSRPSPDSALPPRVRRRVEQQGFSCSVGSPIDDLVPWLRLAPVVTFGIASVATVRASPPIFLGLGILAGTCALVGVHPVDAIYNRVLRRWTKTAQLPPSPAPRRFACGLATIWLVVTALAFHVPVSILGYVLAGVFLLLSLTVATTHFCVGAVLFRLLADRSEFPPPRCEGQDDRDRTRSDSTGRAARR